jgi:dihydrofolate synthase/folylpolyglutamate synthase
MNYLNALEYLKKVQQEGTKLSIGNIKKLVDNLPFSIKGVRFIQVAGTNGKGSTAHFITSILQAQGYRVGLFVSPHLQDIRERITINKQWISREEFAASLTRVQDIIQDLLKEKRIDNMPTFFEHIFLISIDYFYRHKTDFAVLEVGLGGRLDATSTINPQVTCITNISFDHTKTLGSRISDIAREKAGIIKPGVPLVCGCRQNSGANKIIKEESRKRDAPFYNVLNSQNLLKVQEKDGYYYCNYHTETDQYTFDVHLQGEHQCRNAATAVKVIEQLNGNGVNVTKESIYKGIRENFIPGRIEPIDTDPPIILDCSHNVESAKALQKYLQQKGMRGLTLIFGVLRDKKYKKITSLLLPFIKNVIITEPLSQRALEAKSLVPLFNQHPVSIIRDYQEALNQARTLNQIILITGSLYLAGEMRNLILGGKDEYRQI